MFSCFFRVVDCTFADVCRNTCLVQAPVVVTCTAANQKSLTSVRQSCPGAVTPSVNTQFLRITAAHFEKSEVSGAHVRGAKYE